MNRSKRHFCASFSLRIQNFIGRNGDGAMVHDSFVNLMNFVQDLQRTEIPKRIFEFEILISGTVK